MNKIPRKCIVLMGAAGAGKDTVAELINEVAYPNSFNNSASIKFSRKLKWAVAEIFNLDVGDLDDPAYKARFLARPIAGCKTVRELLQWFGTDLLRSYDENVWVNAMLDEEWQVWENEKDDLPPDFYISTDCRFPNEQQALLDTFESCLFVRLVCVGGPTIETSKHASETQDLMTHMEIHIRYGDQEGLKKAAEIISWWVEEDVEKFSKGDSI